MKIIKQYNVFIASPGDVQEERRVVREVCRQMNDDELVRSYRISLRTVGWEDAFPAAGRAQEIINRLVDDCDIFVCLFHKRFGTPSGKADSGTFEEFLLAYDSWKTLNKPHIMFYFKDVQITSSKDFGDPQLKKVIDLREKIEADQLLLFGTCAAAGDFRNKFTEHLKRWISANVRKKEKPAAPPKEIPLEIPIAYRHWIIDHCRYMDVENLKEKSDIIQVRLPEIFVPLFVQRSGRKESEAFEVDEKVAAGRKGSVNLEDLVAEGDYLVVEGLAGSGKTTLVKHIAHQLVEGEGPQGFDGFLPVLMFLKDLKDFDPAGKSTESDPGSAAERILSYYLAKTGNLLELDRIKAFAKAGQAIFLIDGLDEINPALRETVVNGFGDFRCRYEEARVLLTGRPHGVDATVMKRFGERHVRILPFTMAQVEEFITKWFWFIYNRGSKIGEKTADKMINEIKAHPGIEKLIDNPLMLTAICILYHDGRELPGQRAELYKKFINNLLFRRFKDEYEKVHGFLKTLSFDMFVSGQHGIDRIQATKVLGQEYPRRDEETVSEYRSRIDSQFDKIELNCGLLKFQDGQYNFRHLTLQEFLTATATVDRETDYAAAIRDVWDDPRYGEVIELYVGYLSIENKRWANKIVGDILSKPDRPPFNRWRLAARSLLDMHQDRREIDVVDQAVEKLRSIIKSDVGPNDRADAGETLGWLGDRRNLEKFVTLQSGTYPTSRGNIEIDRLELGIYPVTNLWYAKFVKNGGYVYDAAWSQEGKRWLEYTGAKHPALWHERQWNCPNAPVVGVCWYEADAFTRWLTISRDDGFIYRLPDEREWQVAASGLEQKEYPWGDEWQDAYCNTWESKINKISPVGIFRQGNSPNGISDLSGNVWEWTCSDYYAGQKREDFKFDHLVQKLFDEQKFDEYMSKLDQKIRQIPVLKGGSWDDYQLDARSNFRVSNHPNKRNDNIGFRCARTKK